MAQVKLLKISADGVPLEMDTSADDITLNSFTAGAGPVISPTGIDMNNTPVSDVNSVVFTDPTTGTVNQTAGNLVIDNIMAKERNNVMTTSGAILFPAITDVAAQVDSMKMPNIAGVPTATPAFSSVAGYQVFDSTNGDFYIWNGAAWDNQNIVKQAEATIYQGGNAGVGGVAARDVVYYSAADTLLPATAAAPGTSYAVGFSTATVTATNAVLVQQNGVLKGFTGLTAGARYYLSGTTPGQVTATLPTTSGHTIVLCGIAKSTTDILIRIEDLGRRA